MKFIAAIAVLPDDNEMLDGMGRVICVRNGTDSIEKAHEQKDIRKYLCPFEIYQTPEEILARIQQLTENYNAGRYDLPY